MISDLELQHLFQHHPPTLAQIAKYGFIRLAALEFARVVVENTPASADQTAAVRKIREATMTANAAIACHVEPDRDYKLGKLD